MFIIDPKGAIARVAAVPRSQDAMAMGSNVLGAPTLDSKGRLVYRGGMGRMIMAPARRGGPGAGPGGMVMPDFPDSTAIVRVDLATRKVDTVAYFKIPKAKMNITQTDGRMSMTNEINPMPIVDDFAVVSDGSVAIVRGQDYHIDWVSPEGGIAPTREASVRLAAPVRRGQGRGDRFVEDGDGTSACDGGRESQRSCRGRAAHGDVVQHGRRRCGSQHDDGGGRDAAAHVHQPERAARLSSGVRSGCGARGSRRQSLDPHVGGTHRRRHRHDLRRRESEGRARRSSADSRGPQIIGFGRGGVVYMSAQDEKGMWIERAKAREGVRP